MSKVLFFNIPAHGHTNPTLAVVRERADRGEQVLYYFFDEFRDKIEATGAEFRLHKDFPVITNYTKLVDGIFSFKKMNLSVD